MISSNWLYKLFVGSGITATITLLGFIGGGVVENERRNVDEHRNIRREFTQDVGNIKDSMTEILIEQTAQRAILERIEKKL